jgi:hypothetical protein
MTAVCLSLFLGISTLVPAAWSDTPSKLIKQIQYDSLNGELLIENTTQAPFEPSKLSHNTRLRQVSFLLPNTTLQPTPLTLPIQDDPIVKSITLNQRAIEGIPAVKVDVDLYSTAPTIPISTEADTKGLKIVFLRAKNPRVFFAGAVQSPSLQAEANGVSSSEKSADTDAIPLRSSASQPPSRTAEDPRNATPSTHSSSDTVDSVLGPVSNSLLSVIHDIYFDENTLTLVSAKTPISVKKSFTLSEPDRYVVDISPAVLASKSLMRAIPQNNPNIQSCKAGQFDESTVRVVVQFANKLTPVDMRTEADNRVLQLHF